MANGEPNYPEQQPTTWITDKVVPELPQEQGDLPDAAPFAPTVTHEVGQTFAVSSDGSMWLAGDPKGRPALPLFDQWHRFGLLPDAYQGDVRAKLVEVERRQDMWRARNVEVCFVRQGNFTLCVLRSAPIRTAADPNPGATPFAYGMAKRNTRVGSRPGKRPERECPQAGQRAALGRAVDAWLHDKLAWTRPRVKEA